ncbi:pyruvate ferredoxin/flavodoxin oxidoreductase [Amycolatopsis sp. NBRC 101858]|uniref:indolepyruvate ferredoxin oxidoreductase family protein n=1 Tax=Amycolatopsis sp. NBRC 101858 TaxID=3032200 RepID=UPI0024A39ED5|nr:indolepyruvate ferredoxin oxidoreductase family protein [Amycolatopsis sp. NBRC 101858]GLY42893.1 pyruvate ferredoxin/flavodoxin oxidoreductase [Amycolatopsis sp. NBRC 101858]
MADSTARASLDRRYTATEGVVHMTGIHALARLALDVRRADALAGHDSALYISGYEGSPLGGYDLELGKHSALLEEHDVVFRPAVNEELAATAVEGTQLAATMNDKRVDGITGFWYGKSPGLDRASDALRHANLCGTHPAGGAVLFVGDDPTAKSSTVPGASEMLLADLGIPTLYPATQQDVLDFGMHAVALSRASGLWTAVKIVTNVADGSGTVHVDADRLTRSMPSLEVNGEPFTHEVTAKLAGPTLMALERSRNGPRLELARRYAALNDLNTLSGAEENARIGIVAAGKTFADVGHSLRTLGLAEDDLAKYGIRLLQLGMIYPLEPAVIDRFAAGLEEIVVVEEKRPFLEAAIKEQLYGRHDAPVVTGKRAADGRELLSTQGELGPEVITDVLAQRILAHSDVPAVAKWQDGRRPRSSRISLPLAVRTPYFCSGCPHNTSTKTPAGSLVGAGIGCHALALVMSPELVGDIAGLTQMGGEGAQWLGMSPFLTRTHMLQNIGDGTFHHSGSLAVRAAIAGGANITYKLLYNSAVAMTGGQQAEGQMTVGEITRAMRAEGVKKIIVTTDEPRSYRRRSLARGVKVWHRDRIIEAQEVLATVEGVTMLIHDQECATELRRKRKRGLAPEPAERVVINERVCEGCGDCGVQSNCLSVQPVDTEFGRKTRIDQSSCNKDFSCLKGDCPSFLTVIPAAAKEKAARPRADRLDATSLPEPPTVELTGSDHHTTRILGIGGAGVVTVSQILSVAATNAGLHVQSLDQTGLAQKGGAVVSDVKISTAVFEGANKAATGEADLYVGADLLVAADPAHLMAAEPGRTVAVVSTGKVPTGGMVSDPARTFPDLAALTGRVRESTDGERGVFFDARAVSNALFGQDQFANLLLVGAACQSGALPIPAGAIEEAITLNDVQVDSNTQAFRRGRQLVSDPAAFHAAVGALPDVADVPATLSPAVRTLVANVGAPPDSELSRLVSIRIPDLVGYQSVHYATGYAEFVGMVRRLEAERVPGSTAISEAVARYLYKLMAYKDEYEVARLSLAPDALDAVQAQFGSGARIAYRLHPPVLRALGMRKKISLGAWFKPVFRVLVALRRVRGTRLDFFGYAHVRKVERELVTEYRSVVAESLATLRLENAHLVVKIATLPDGIRGYESIKLGNVENYRRELVATRQELEDLNELPLGTGR